VSSVKKVHTVGKDPTF